MAKEKQGRIIPVPVNILWQGILLIPIFGILDSKRAQEVMESTLNKIVETESSTVILDILGVTTVDSSVANHLIKITKATKLMGCNCIISGISPQIAKAMVSLGVELGDVATRTTLRDALEFAFKTAGLEVRSVEVSKQKRS